MKINGADIVVKALEAEGVRWTFGIPGTHNTELYDALDRSEQITPILVTDEQAASFMADGVSRSSDQVGVINVVPGAGLTHALSGVAEAYMDNIPLVVLGCGIRTDTGRSYQLHHIDQMAVIRPVVKGTFKPQRAEDIAPMIQAAFRLARSGTPGPVAIEIPANFYLVGEEIPELKIEKSGIETPPAAASAQIDQAADILNASKSPFLYIGNGARGCSPALIRLAEALGAPVTTTITGKGVFSETHPLWLWNGFGNQAPAFVQEITNRADCLLAIGCRFGEVATASYGINPPENLIHVDINPEVLNKNYKARLGIASDAGKFLEGLLDRVRVRPKNNALEEEIKSGHQELWRYWLANTALGKVTPAHFLKTLQEILGPEAIYTTDSGNGTFLAMEFLRLTKPASFFGPVDYSCMGYSVPAAIGAKMANPNRPVAALAGDGALLMTGLELITAANYGAGVMVFVLRDGELGQIVQFQRTTLNRDTCSVLHDYDLKAFAQTVGAAYFDMPNDTFIEGVIKEAVGVVGNKKPVIVNVNIDYSQKTFFTKGVVKTNLLRLSWPDRLRMITRALGRHLLKL
ncbi:MAG: thiamine pyrophosphate-binding protein [Elusimicrobia bacterium]|nr:thiamine pyrophosphate-binding protein [Elusimicrobiota bacterium]